MPDPIAAFDTLLSLGFTRVLTSGGAATAAAGADTLARLVGRAAGTDTAILAAGSVRAGNARALVERTGVREIHLRAMRDRPGRPPATDAAEIAAVIEAVRP